MAITHIHPITVTESKALDYITEDKIREDFQEEDSVINSIDYIVRDKKESDIIIPTLSTFVNCSMENRHNEFAKIRKLHNKNSGNLSYHVWQSFEENIEPEIAHEIGLKLANELFSDYQYIVSTHANTNHTHNHIIFNSVAIADGKKYNDCNSTYRNLRKVSDRLCIEYGLNVLEKTQNYKTVKYVNEKGEIAFFEPTDRKFNVDSLKFMNVSDYRNYDSFSNKDFENESLREIIKKDFDSLIKDVCSYDDFLNQLLEMGYSIKSRKTDGEYLKNISFKHPNAQRYIRDYSIGEFYVRKNLTRYLADNITNKTENLSNSILKSDVDYDNKYISILVSDSKIAYSKIDKEFVESVRLKSSTPYISDRNAYLISMINLNMETVTFVNSNNISSYADIKNIMSSLIEKRNLVYNNLSDISIKLKDAFKTAALINKYNSICDDPQKLNERELILKSLARKNITSSDFESYLDSYVNLSTKFDELKSAMTDVNALIDKESKYIKAISKANERLKGKMDFDLDEFEKFKKECYSSRYEKNSEKRKSQYIK